MKRWNAVLASLLLSGVATASTTPAAPRPDCLADTEWVSRLKRGPGGEPVFRVWVRCTASWKVDLDRAYREVDPFWQQLEALYVAARKDTGTPDPPPLKAVDLDPDEALDLYVVNSTDAPPRGARRLPAAAAAGGDFREPLALYDNTQPLMLLARDGMGSQPWKSALVHELARAFIIAQRPAHETTWVTEALATWTETHLIPDAAADTVYRPLFAEGLQTMNPVDRHAPIVAGIAGRKQSMMSFLLMTFAAQEGGGPAGVKQVFDALGTTDAAPDHVLRAVLGALHWNDAALKYALRSIDSTFDGDKPLGPLFDQGNPGFPLELKPLLATDVTMNPRPPNTGAYAVEVKLPVLGAQHMRFKVNPSVQQLKIDWKRLPPADRGIALLSHVKGKPWTLETLTGDSKYFCRARPEQQIEEFWIVVANTSTDSGHTVAGAIEVTPSAQPCQVLKGGATWAHSEQRNTAENGSSSRLEVRLEVTLKNLLFERQTTEDTPYLFFRLSEGSWSVDGIREQDESIAGQPPCSSRERVRYQGSGRVMPDLLANPAAALGMPFPTGATNFADPSAMNGLQRSMTTGHLIIERGTGKALLRVRLMGIDAITRRTVTGEGCGQEVPEYTGTFTQELLFKGRVSGTADQPRVSLEFSQDEPDSDDPALHRSSRGSGDLQTGWRVAPLGP